MRIYLIGYMGSGKSTTGKKIANKLSMEFIDTDVLFEEKYKISIVKFFEKYDEIAFRKLEQAILQETISKDNIVIATGGGTPCFRGNMDFINSSGISVYLKIDSKSVLHRIKSSIVRRPILSNIPEEELMSYIEKQIGERESFYLKAHITHKSEDIDINELESKINDLKIKIINN